MSINDFEWKLENEWLDRVLKEVERQLEEQRGLKDRFRKDALDTQRELWEEVGSVSIANELDQIVDFYDYINMMKRQKRSHDFTAKLEEKLERMLLSPYFGRMDFLEKGFEGSEKFYLGISNLIDDNYNFLVYDWRAPVSGMFYDFEVGEARYSCPEGIIEGEITLKRQYRIKNSKLEYMFDSNLKIDDEMLQDILGKSADSKMKTIVTTIQKEQNRVIRNEEYKNLIVQGPAGSGKTSVALHRIAYLLYKYRDKITPQNIIIFSPNQIFNDYISNVLPELGEENMGQTTFKEYMHKALGGDFAKEAYCDMMEYILSKREAPAYGRRINNIKYKSSTEFIEALKRYAAFVDKMNRNFSDIIVRGKVVVGAKELTELFNKDYAQFPLKRRLQKIRERLLFILEPLEKGFVKEAADKLRATGDYIDEMEVTELGITAIKGEMKDAYEEVNRITRFDLMEVYRKLFENLEAFSVASNDPDCSLEDIKNYTIENLKAKTLYYEDQPPLLFLKGLLGDLPRTSEIKYVIIDEAQDYTPLQYEILYQLFGHASITMLGDLNQSINPYMNVGNYKNISGIFPEEDTCLINLTKSYRSTMEITNFSRKILLGDVNSGYVERHGEEPVVLGFQSEEEIKARLLKDIEAYKEKGFSSIGILTRTVEEANDVFGFLKDKTQVERIIRDDDEYLNDTLVIPSHLAKGLEFDVVLVYNAGDGNYNREEERLLFYTACTRALHVLNVYYTGELTMFLQ